MTLSAYTPLSYNGDGVTDTFAVSFTFWENTDLLVTKRDVLTVETTLTLGTEYTVTGGEGSTGSVVFNEDYIPISGDKIFIKSAVPQTQTSSLPAGGELPSATVEEMVDRAIRNIQQAQEEINRSIRLSTASDDVLPFIPDHVASSVLGTDSSNNFTWTTIASLPGGSAEGVDETDTNATKNKLVSNQLINRYHNTIPALTNVLLSGQAVTTSNTNGNLELNTNGTGIVNAKKDVQFDSGKGILDSNGKLALLPAAIASAVNYIKVTNAATGSGPTLEPDGTDGNADFNLKAKGTGNVSFSGVKLPNADGTSNQILVTNGSGVVSWSNLITNAEVFTSSGTYTPTLTGNVIIIAQGAGGGGAGGDDAQAGVGGGSGAKLITVASVTKDVGVTVTVGAKGTGGTFGAPGGATDGGDGGDSSFGSLVAGGGDGGHVGVGGGTGGVVTDSSTIPLLNMSGIAGGAVTGGGGSETGGVGGGVPLIDGTGVGGGSGGPAGDPGSDGGDATKKGAGGGGGGEGIAAFGTGGAGGDGDDGYVIVIPVLK